MDSTINRRALVRGALALGGSLLLAACGGAAAPTPAPASGASGGTAPKPAAAPALTYKGKITVWFPFNPREERTNPFGGREKALTKMSTYGKKWEELHPGVTIDYFEGPNVATSTTEFRQWLVTQANGDTLPHIAPTHRAYRNQFVGSNWFAVLDPFYEDPNPYVPAGGAGSKRWMDQWKTVESLVAESKDERGKQIHWFPSYNGRGIFYNPDLLDKAGVKPPTTFEEFMQACEKVKASGAIAFQARPKAAFGLNQMWNSIANTLEESAFLEMDLNKNGEVETEELARGVKKGIYGSQAKSVQAAWSLAKRTSQYFAPNWNSADTRQLYVTGKLAMTEEGSFYMPILLADKELKFKPAVFDFPNITKETSPLAADVTYQLK